MRKAVKPGGLDLAALRIVAFAFAVTMLGSTLPTPLYPLFASRFDLSTLMVTVVYAVYAAGVLGTLLVFGRLSDSRDRRLVLLLGLALSALGAGIFLFASGVPALLLARLVAGLSTGLVSGTATAALVDATGPERRRLATLVATLATMAGFGCGPLLAGALAEWAPDPLRLPFLVDLALIAAAAVGIWRLPAAAPLNEETVRPRLLAVPRATCGVFAVAALGSFVGFGALSLFTGLAPTFLADLIGVSNHAVAGALVASTFVASVAGQLMLGQLPGRQGLRVGGGIMAAGLLLLAVGIAEVSAVLFVAAGLVTGFGQGVAYRGGLAAINEAAPPSHRAGLASSFFFCVYVGISVPLVGLGLFSQVAGLRVAGVAFALLMATFAVAVGLRGGDPVVDPAPGRVS